MTVPYDEERGPFPIYRVLLEEHNLLSPDRWVFLQEIEAQRLIFEDKYAGIADPDDRRRQVESALVGEVYRRIHATGVKRSAVCFSGGGIRSATFGLGIVQGLAHYKLLHRMDYLSTVSGGGYLGSWLTGWIHQERQVAGSGAAALKKVECELASPPLTRTPLRPEPDPICHLRSYSRYMSPKVGLLSADTWTLVAIFLRNLLLNWLVLLPLIAAVLMIPRFSVFVLQHPLPGPWRWVPFWVSVAGGIMAISYIIANRPSLAAAGGAHRYPDRYRGQWWFLWLCLLPLALMAVGITIFWVWTRTPMDQTVFHIWFLSRGFSALEAFMFFGILLHVGGFLVSRYWVWSAALWELAIAVLTGALGGWLAWVAAKHVFPRLPGAGSPLLPGAGPPRDLELYVCFAAPLLLGLFLVAATLFVGLSSYFTDDGDREWLARCGAWMLIAVFARGALSGLVIFGPEALTSLKYGVPWLLSTAGGVSGLVTLVLGRSARTAARHHEKEEEGKGGFSLADAALSFAAPVFAVFLLAALALATTWLIEWVSSSGSRDPIFVLFHARGEALLGVLFGLLAVGGAMSYLIDINRFSLHAAYRDRLIRAYLGASRPQGKRKPNPFTGFDEHDNVLMRDLQENRPLHVVNMALNLVAGQKLAWQDRKAESFTVTPFYAGSYPLGYRKAEEYGLHRGRSHHKAISLGTAMAISGAAASPNMGYHSSSVVTFLLALFNVRLGWWLGNPGAAGDDTFNTPGPRPAARPLISEAFGLTDDHNPYVYLSDGGHFENLGLYEMVLRRCHFIVVSDAEQDEGFKFEGLANAVAKIRTDLGVPIVFDRILMQPRDPSDRSYDLAHGDKPVPYAAIGRIMYTCVDAGPNVEDGYLLYFKASLNGTEPVDVFNYAKTHPGFPHESTGDQLYTEAQFESYRALGRHAFESVARGLPETGSDLQALFNRVQRGPIGRAPRAG